MQYYDISQPVFSCQVYPGHEAPRLHPLVRMDQGERYNLSGLSMGVHNGTHIDAPFHFLEQGATVDRIPLEKTMGLCYVAPAPEILGAEGAQRILDTARRKHPESARRILLKGPCLVTEEAARAFAGGALDLLGVESQCVGPEQAPMAVHKILLGANVVLLEGVRLAAVVEGVYFLSAAPLLLEGSDGGPCRAVLIGE